jgi:hypothetical protein
VVAGCTSLVWCFSLFSLFFPLHQSLSAIFSFVFLPACSRDLYFLLNLFRFQLLGFAGHFSICGSGAFKTAFVLFAARYAGWMGGDGGGG